MTAYIVISFITLLSQKSTNLYIIFYVTNKTIKQPLVKTFLIFNIPHEFWKIYGLSKQSEATFRTYFFRNLREAFFAFLPLIYVKSQLRNEGQVLINKIFQNNNVFYIFDSFVKCFRTFFPEPKSLRSLSIRLRRQVLKPQTQILREPCHFHQ